METGAHGTIQLELTARVNLQYLQKRIQNQILKRQSLQSAKTNNSLYYILLFYLKFESRKSKWSLWNNAEFRLV